jgi:hypothetical protein
MEVVTGVMTRARRGPLRLSLVAMSPGVDSITAG